MDFQDRRDLRLGQIIILPEIPQPGNIHMHHPAIL